MSDDKFAEEANRLALQDMKSAQLRFAARVEHEQPMSDTLQEREDQLPLVSKNYSERECSEPDCPCHEWVKRDAVNCPRCGRTMQSDFDPDVGMWRECAECDYREAVSSASAHQPAARGGGEEWRVVALGRNTYIERDGDDPFICDMQTYESSDAERKEARQLAHKIVDEHRQHQALVAERESLQQTLVGISLLAHAAWIGCNKRGDQPMAATFAEIENAAAEAVHQQRSTSE